MNFPTPAVTTTLADIGSWAVPIFNDFFPWAKMAIGIFIAFAMLGVIVFWFRSGAHSAH